MRFSHSLVLTFAVVGKSLSAFVGSSEPEGTIFGSTSNQDVTFIDSVYGELVDGEYERNVKKQFIENNILEVYKDGGEEDSDSYATENEQLRKGNTRYGFFNAEMQQKEVYSQNAHAAFQKYKAKLSFPDKDDASDLSTTPNLFGGIVTFSHFPHINCFDSKTLSETVDIAVVGAPFDTGTSYRPGARFGPEAIRSSSRRMIGSISSTRGSKKGSKESKDAIRDSIRENLTFIDCGDVPMTPFDNRIALDQLYRGIRSIHRHKSNTRKKTPKVLTIGGDHTITLMALKSAFEHYGRVSVIHFDSHIDTWDPKVLGGGLTHYMQLNHGTFLHYAHEKGYLSPTNFHVGMRAPYIDTDFDPKHDAECGFQIITAKEFDTTSKKDIIKRIKDTVGDGPVYVTVDIDVLDPAFAPGTGTMEIGGLSSRELLNVLDGLRGLNVVGADVVEVSPPYDTNSEITSLAATSTIDSLLGLMIEDEIKIT